MDTEVPDIGVNTLRPTRYEPLPRTGVVEENMTSWYAWLVSHVPETIRRPVSVAYRKMKDKVMSLFKQTSDYEVTPVRRLLSDAVSHHEVLPRDETISPQNFLREVRRLVISFIRDNLENKIQISLICKMMRTDPVTWNIVSVEQAAFNSRQEAVYDATDLEDLYERMVSKILESFSAYLRKGSGWALKGVVRLDITRAENKPLKGSSHMPLPKGMRRVRLLA